MLFNWCQKNLSVNTTIAIYFGFSILLNILNHFKGLTRVSIKLTMLIYNWGYLAITLFNGGYRIKQIDLYSTLICIFKAGCNFFNSYFYWHYCLYHLSKNGFNVGQLFGQILREIIFIMINVNARKVVVASMIPIALTLPWVSALSFKFKDLLEGFFYMCIPRTLSWMADLLYHNIPSRDFAMNNLISSITLAFMTLCWYVPEYLNEKKVSENRAVGGGTIDYPHDKAVKEVGFLSGIVKHLDRWIILLCFLKGENKIWNAWLVHQRPVLTKLILDKGAHVIYLMFLGDLNKSGSILQELGSLVLKDRYLATNAKWNVGAGFNHYKELFGAGIMLYLLQFKSTGKDNFLNVGKRWGFYLLRAMYLIR